MADVCQTAHQMYFLYRKGSRWQHCSIGNCAEDHYHQQDAHKILQKTQNTFSTEHSSVDLIKFPSFPRNCEYCGGIEVMARDFLPYSISGLLI